MRTARHCARTLGILATAYVACWVLTITVGVAKARVASEWYHRDIVRWSAYSPAPFVVRAEVAYVSGGFGGGDGLGTYVWLFGLCREVHWRQGTIACMFGMGSVRLR